MKFGILEEETSALKQTTFDDVKDASRFDDTCLTSGTVSKQNSSNSLSDSIAIDETRNLIGCSLSGSNESSSGAIDSSHSSINLNSTDLIRVKSEPMAVMENSLNSQEVEQVSHVSRRVQKGDRNLRFDNRRRQAIYSTDKLSYDGSSSCVPENMVTHCLSVETENQHVAEKGESLCVEKKTLKQHLARKEEKQIAEEMVEKQCILEKLASQCLAERMANKSKSSRNRKISSSSVADPCIAASSEVRRADETVSLRVSKQTDSVPTTDQNSSSKISNNERKNCYNAQKYSSDEISSAAVKALNQWKATRKAVATAHSQIADKKTKMDVDRYSKKQETSSANGKNRFDAIYRKAEIAASKPGFLSTPIPRKTKIMSTSRDVENAVDHDVWAKDFDPSGDVVHLKFKGKTLEGVVIRPESFSASLEESDPGSSQFAANDPPKDKFKRAEKSNGVDAVLQSEKSWNQTGIQCEESCDEPVARI